MTMETEVEPRALPCPACRVPLHEVVVGGLAIDECRRCDGLWLDDQEPEQLVTLLGELGSAFQPLAFDDSAREIPAGQRPCPRCELVLEVWPFRGVEVEVCPSCRGLWLDRWEWQRLVEG